MILDKNELELALEHFPNLPIVVIWNDTISEHFYERPELEPQIIDNIQILADRIVIALDKLPTVIDPPGDYQYIIARWKKGEEYEYHGLFATKQDALNWGRYNLLTEIERLCLTNAPFSVIRLKKV